jgi:hypothetical protein
LSSFIDQFFFKKIRDYNVKSRITCNISEELGFITCNRTNNNKPCTSSLDKKKIELQRKELRKEARKVEIDKILEKESEKHHEKNKRKSKKTAKQTVIAKYQKE